MVVDLRLGASLPLARLPLCSRRGGWPRLPPCCVHCGRSLHRGRSARSLHRSRGALALRRARRAASRRPASLGGRAPGRSSSARTRTGGAARAATPRAAASRATAAAAARTRGGCGGGGDVGGGGGRVECGERTLRSGGGALHGGDGLVPSCRLVDCLGGRTVSKQVCPTTQAALEASLRYRTTLLLTTYYLPGRRPQP